MNWLPYALIVVSAASAADTRCSDDPSFHDSAGYPCSTWTHFDCTHVLAEYSAAYTADDLRNVRRRCPAACELCHRAPGRVDEVVAALSTADSGPRLAWALRAVHRAPRAAARHLAVGDAALPYAHAFAIERTRGVAGTVATARAVAVAAYRAATALGDRSFAAREDKAFDEFCNGLQEDASRAAMAIVDIGEIGQASIILRKAINMQPQTKLATKAAHFISVFRSARLRPARSLPAKLVARIHNFFVPQPRRGLGLTTSDLITRVTRASKALKRRLCNARVAPRKRAAVGGWPAAACGSPQPCSQDAVDRELALVCDRKTTAARVREVLQHRTLDGFYHVGVVGNWRDVVADQLTTLISCGVLDVARSLTISYSVSKAAAMGAAAELQRMVQTLTAGVAADVRLEMSTATEAPWEADAIKLAAGHCKAESSRTSDQRLVFYMHNKGVTWHRPDWLAHFGRYRTYARVLYWRKYLEYFLIQHPQWCISALVGGNHTSAGHPDVVAVLANVPNEGAMTCGVDLHTCEGIAPPHYSGNFWYARCDYIQTLSSSSNALDNNYHAAEMWIGQGMVKTTSALNRDGGWSVGPRHASLFESLEARWTPWEQGERAIARTLYEDVFHPADYQH